MDLLQSAVQSLAPGRYVVAVSGGVDSMVLLDLLRRQPSLELVVAQVNHGMREDARLDAQLVAKYCTSHNIMFVSKKLDLSPKASENTARIARYDFLQKCRITYYANAIVTAHHADDLLETVIINLLRGTGWKGVAPFVENTAIARPLVKCTKTEILAYANKYGIAWREDSTNNDQSYLRNYVRKTVIPFLRQTNPTALSDIMRLIRKQQVLRRTIHTELDAILTSLMRLKNNRATAMRYSWIMLPPPEAYELFQTLCTKTIGHTVVRSTAESALIFIKTARINKVMPLVNGWQLRVTRREFIVEPPQSMVK